MAKAKTNASLAAALCRKFPDTPSKALGRMLYQQNVELFVTPNAAYQAIRYVRGAKGKHNRQTKGDKHQDVERPHGRAGEPLACPPSSAEKWEPVQVDGPCNVLVLSDLHVPYHDARAIEAAIVYAKKKHRPHGIDINGDLIDFHRISRWEADPKARDTKAEIDTAKEMLAWLRRKFPQAWIKYKLGNHCERLDKYIWQKAPELWNLENVQLHHLLDFETLGIDRVDDQPIVLGKLPVMHGHEFGKSGIAAPVNPARGAFLRTLHSCLVGHLHRTSTHCEPNMWQEETTTWSAGCLCDRRPRYARVNKWNLGFAVVEVAADNSFNVHNYRLSEDYQVRTA